MKVLEKIEILISEYEDIIDRISGVYPEYIPKILRERLEDLKEDLKMKSNL